MPKKYRKRSSFNLLGFVLPLIILGLAGAIGWRIYPQFIASNFGKFDRINLVVEGQNTTLVSLNVSDKSAVIIQFPQDLYISEVTHGYGQLKISSVYEAGQIDNRGGETLAATIQEYLGIPIEGYIRSKDFNDPKAFFLSPDFFLETNTNLSHFDRGKITLVWSGVRFDKITKYDLKDYTSSLVLADGSSAQTLDKLEVDGVLASLFTEQKIQAENLRIEVLNSTKVVGLGARAVRLLSNIGMNVINVESTTDPLTVCQIETSSKALNSVSLSRIKQIYSCRVNQKDDLERADVRVILGSEYAEWLTK